MTGSLLPGRAGAAGGGGARAASSAVLKNPGEIGEMDEAAGVVRRALVEARDACVAGVTLHELDRLIAEEIGRGGAEPLFLGYRQGDSPPFPGVACISVDEEVVHGVPGMRRVRAGDLVSIDVGLRLGGWCADSSTTFVVEGGGAAREGAAALAEAGRRHLEAAVPEMRAGRRWSEVATVLERLAAAEGFAVVHQYVGHGLGRSLHEPPKVPAYWTGFDGSDFVLREGMVLAVEPMLTCPAGGVGGVGGGGSVPMRAAVRLLDDGWTVATADGSLACHEERMVAVTAGGPRVLGGW